MSLTINKTSQVIPETSDLIAIWDTSDSTTRNTSISRLITLFQETVSVGKPATQYASPSAGGFNVDLIDTGLDVHLIMLPSGILATGSVTLPASPHDKQTVLVNTTKMITTFTVISAKTVSGAPSTLAADDFFTLKYDLTTDSWYRVG